MKTIYKLTYPRPILGGTMAAEQTCTLMIERYYDSIVGLWYANQSHLTVQYHQLRDHDYGAGPYIIGTMSVWKIQVLNTPKDVMKGMNSAAQADFIDMNVYYGTEARYRRSQRFTALELANLFFDSEFYQDWYTRDRPAKGSIYVKFMAFVHHCLGGKMVAPEQDQIGWPKKFDENNPGFKAISDYVWLRTERKEFDEQSQENV